MGIEIDKVSGNNTAQDLLAITRLNADVKRTENTQKTEQEDAINKASKQDDKKAHLDTYKKSTVTNSIEQQIKEQQAKIDEISKNLEGLKEAYTTTDKAKDTAIAARYKAGTELHQKEVSENGLKRLFYEWRMKHLRQKEDEMIDRTFKTYYSQYDDAMGVRKHASKFYDIAEAEAFAAIRAHTFADIDYMTALWSKQDAYWQLAKMQMRLIWARHVENSRRFFY
ncbi:MAG: hypothetical protein K6E29_06490 [Cyanobacteria bacterium RUI128]|nr:hypothetical protein [Cyanobacteria bacterium RUI128]